MRGNDGRSVNCTNPGRYAPFDSGIHQLAQMPFVTYQCGCPLMIARAETLAPDVAASVAVRVAVTVPVEEKR